MDEDERDEILYTLDERTKSFNEKLDSFDNRISENREDIQTNDDRISSNTNSISSAWKAAKAIGAAGLAAFSGVGAYLADLIHL